MDRQSFINAMRCVATPVTLVSTNGPHGRHGATVSAMCSVSADPPSLLVCLNVKSAITRFVEENGAFSVNVVADDQSDVASAFAGMPSAKTFRSFDTEYWEDGHMDLPKLVGATASFFCTVNRIYTQDTHRIVIGKVHEVNQADTNPVLYFDGAFRELSAR